MSEVLAVRRALFNGGSGDVSPTLAALDSHRGSLASAVQGLSDRLVPHWGELEAKLAVDPGVIGPVLLRDFDVEEIAGFFPPARDLNLRVVFDRQLKEASGQWTVRRVGVWQIQSVSGKTTASLGVITPRLTRSSLFVDQLFHPYKESAAALLVRGLLLQRLLGQVLPGAAGSVVVSPDPTPQGSGGPFLRAVVARPGAKLPEASVEAAVHFLQTYPDPVDAWNALLRWADGSCQLTVAKDGFVAAHRNAQRFLRRAETPERDDINVLLPLAWDDKARVVRVTFSRPPVDESADGNPE